MGIEIELVPDLIDEKDTGISAIVKGQPQGLLWAKNEATLYSAIASIQAEILRAERDRRRRGDKRGHIPWQELEVMTEDDMFALQWPDLPGFALCVQSMDEFGLWIGEFVLEAVELLNAEEKRKKKGP